MRAQKPDEIKDMELALKLASYIRDSYVCPESGQNDREFYIDFAKRVSKTFTNPGAQTFLQAEIDEHLRRH